MKSIFVDSSAWIALYNPQDQHHAAIVPVWQSLAKKPVSLVTSDYVLDEVYTFLRRRAGLQACMAFNSLVVSSSVLNVLDVTPTLRHQAWEILTKHDDKVLSFTDCTSFAVMRQLHLMDVLTFDDDFRKAGFLVIP